METNHVQWGEAICLVHALFPELSFQITGPEKVKPDHIATAFGESGINLQWVDLNIEMMSDLEILVELIPDIDALSGQAILVCDGWPDTRDTDPIVLSIPKIEQFVRESTERSGKRFFFSNAVVIVPENQALYMLRAGRSITSYHITDS